MKINKNKRNFEKFSLFCLIMILGIPSTIDTVINTSVQLFLMLKLPTERIRVKVYCGTTHARGQRT